MAKLGGKHSQNPECGPSEILRFVNTLQGTPVTLFEHDHKLRYTWVFNANPKFGIPNDQFLGKTDAQLFSNKLAKQLTQIKKSVLKSGENMRTEVSAETDGQTLYFDLSIEPLRNASGCIVGLSCVASEITARKKLEIDFEESHRLYAMAERLAGIGHFIRDFENDTIFWSPQIFRIFGLDQNQPAPRIKLFFSLVHPNDHQKLNTEIQAVLSTGEARIFEYRVIRPDGTQRDIRSTIEAIDAPNEKYTSVRGILQDITKERILKQRIAHIHRAEREAIYRDLHDSVCQELAGIGFLADSIRDALDSNNSTVLKDIKKIIACTKKAISLASDIARNQSPLDESDPAALNIALKALTSYIKDIYGVRCSIVSRKQIRISDNIVAMHLFHIAREAAINAARHSQANRIRILFSKRKNKIILRVSDDGKGIKIPKNKIAGGLAIMRSRAEIIGAVLDISISDKTGTVVECCIEAKK